LSRIAIIDTSIDPAYIGGRTVEYVNVCDDICNDYDSGISHGSLCAITLDCCASDYDLVNIRIFDENKLKVFGEIEVLAKALNLCRELCVDVVSLSAMSSILSDSKHLYDITKRLAENAVIISALDNRRYISVPTSYPHIVGVRSDIAGLLSLGEIAYSADDPYNANIFANCDFAFLRNHNCAPSNSIAVPVVAAHVNGLLNQGCSVWEIKSLLESCKLYPVDPQDENLAYHVSSDDREIPVVYLARYTVDMCQELMDAFCEDYEVQSTGLSFLEGSYDVRIKRLSRIDDIGYELRFMERHYKTDLIFILGSYNQLWDIKSIIEIDIWLTKLDNGGVLIGYDNEELYEVDEQATARLHEILTNAS